MSLSYIVSFIQVLGDAVCLIFSGALLVRYGRKRIYNLLFLSFLALLFSDIYYNLAFRIYKWDILLSGEIISVAPLIIFQITQLYVWYKLSALQNIKIFSWLNLPYILFSLATSIIIVYFFSTTDRLSIFSTLEDVLSVILDLLVWFFAIVCFSRTKNNAIALMSLGCTMIMTASLTMTCLFRFNMNDVELTEWPHIIWAIGVVLMAGGMILFRKNDKVEFYSQNSMHVYCNWWLLMSSLTVFVIGFGFTFLFNGVKNVNEIHYVLWNVPVSLMFTMIISNIFSNRFSSVILSPINSFSQSIESFNKGEKYEIKVKNHIKEFKVLGEFIAKSFTRVSDELEQEVKISAQVAHDIRSPLAALQIGINSLPAHLEESSRILLRDAVQNIRDIANSLDKSNIHKLVETKHLTQLANILDSVISERRLALTRKDIRFNPTYSHDSYGYFIEIVPSTLKRILTNILNNAYEAIGDNSGEIIIDLKSEHDLYVINIIDNGCGIPEKNLKNLFNRGFTTKKEGKGLGIFHAKEALSEWNAGIAISSVMSKGTKITIHIPKAPKPYWFVSKLTLLENEPVVCVDDNQSIFQSWKERFKLSGITNPLIYCSSLENFTEVIADLKYTSTTYLIDFEFSGKEYKGFDFVDLLMKNQHTSNRIYLVTSHSEEKEIQDYAEANSIRMIPKNFAVKMPLEIFDTKKKTIILTNFKNLEERSENKVYFNRTYFVSDMSYFTSSMRIFIQKHFYDENMQIEMMKHGLRSIIFESIDELDIA